MTHDDISPSAPTPRPGPARWRRVTAWLGPNLWPNALALTGSAVALACAALICAVLVMNLAAVAFDQDLNPYVDLIGFVVLPGFFTLGVLMILAGRWQHRRRLRQGEFAAAARSDQAAEAAMGRRAVLLGGTTFASLVILGVFSYEAYHFTDSPRFCTDICHTVMQPEATAYRDSPHARVACVSCHIGPGASWFVRAKLSGLRQVWATATDSYTRPIPTPVENLRPAQDTCEICHWPAKFTGSRLVVRRHFEPDRDNSPSVSALIMKIGGPAQGQVPAHGIHWHVDPANQVRYRHTDRERREIVEVVQRTPEGEVRYLKEGADPADTTGHWRVMDCLDCHNRPTHIFETPAGAVETAMAQGRLDARLPWLRRAAERVLLEVEPDARDRAVTTRRVAERLEAIYLEEHAEDLAALRAGLAAAAAGLTDILARNVFPAMEVTWGTYPSHLSHFDQAGDLSDGGCFRCHDEMHASPDGRVISQDCETCHAVISERERDPARMPDYLDAFVAR